MASAWSESGIDWGNLQNYSPRDIIKELYIATSERNYWIRYFGSGGYATLGELEPIDYEVTLRHRTKDQIDFILSSINSWLSTTKAPTQTGNDLSYAKQGFEGCLIDYEEGSNYNYAKYGSDNLYSGEYYAPNTLGNIRENTLIEEIQLGYNSFDRSTNGALETKAGVDLSFIRNYNSGITQRFTYEMMKFVYDLLNYFTFVRRCTYKNASYSGRSAVSTISNFNTAYMSQGTRGDGITRDFNQARSYLYDKVFARSNEGITFYPLLGITGNNIGDPTFERWTMYHGGSANANTFTEISVTGLNGQTFETDFFDHKNAIYNLSFSYDSLLNISYPASFTIPSRPIGHTIRDNPFTQLNDENIGDINIDIDPEGLWAENSFGRINDGDIPSSVETADFAYRDTIQGLFMEQTMPMLNFNKEGFLKYYTEPTN